MTKSGRIQRYRLLWIGVVYVSFERATFEGAGAERIPLTDRTYTYPKQNVYVLR